MRLFNPLLFSALFFIISIAPQPAQAAKTFKMSPGNFLSTFHQIKNDYSYLFGGDEIIDSLYIFLQNKLNIMQINPDCQAPEPRISNSPQGGLNFFWGHERNDKSMVSYFKLATGASEEYETSSPGIVIPLFDYQYTLFTFVSQCGQKQGFVNLIIVERDIFSFQGGNDQNNRPTTSFIDQASSFPNPFSDQLTLAFQLEQQQDIAITIKDLHGRLMLPVIRRGSLAGGYHEEVLDLSGLPAGIYFCTLNNETLQTIRLIKRE